MNRKKRKGLWFVLAIVLTLVFLYIVMAVYLFIVPDGNLGDAFSLGQLFLESILLPVAALGFWMTYQEFRKSQRRPGLYLAWDDDELTNKRELVLHLKRPDMGSKKTPDRLNYSIALHNEGDNVATWYSVHLTFPIELLGANPPGTELIPHYWSPELVNLWGFYREFGGEENWNRETSLGKQEDIFQSNGTLASFPKQKIKLGTIKTHPLPEGEGDVQRYEIRYKIFTDIGPVRADILKLVVHWTD